MSWRPLDIFKSEAKSSNKCTISSGNYNMHPNENTARSLFVNSSVAKSFNDKVSIVIRPVENKVKK